MAKFNKAKWQDAANELEIEFQTNDSIDSLVERIAFKLKVKTADRKEVQEAYIAQKEKPKKKKAPKKDDGVKFSKIIADREERICLMIKGHEVWFPKKYVSVNKSGKSISMPDWLKELKVSKLKKE